MSFSGANELERGLRRRRLPHRNVEEEEEEEEEVGKKLCSFVLASHPWQSASPQMGGTKQKEETENDLSGWMDGRALIRTGASAAAADGAIS